jgi:hypothetical protein
MSGYPSLRASPGTVAGYRSCFSIHTTEVPVEISRRVVQINEYELTGSPDAFVDAITALARRTEAEGHPGVLSYQFFVNRELGSAGATIIYENGAAWLAHHQLAYQWEEMPVLQSTVALQRLTLFGPLGDELHNWLADAEISYIHYDTFAAGFVRG